MAGRLWAGRGSRGAGRSWPMRAACSLAASPLLAFTSWSLRCLHRSMSGVYRRIAGEDGVARLGDFGLAEVAAELGVGVSRVVAFGDMPNDVPMLSWAGHGVAMGNAHADALAAADEVAAPHTEDGVAQVLERWWG